MGSGNSNCQEQNCWDECCNQYAKCPDDYDYFEDGSDYATCEYYYTDNTWVLSFIIPIVVVLIFTIIIVICIRKRRQQQQQWTGNQQVVIATQDNFGNQPTYGQQQPYGQQQYQPGYTEQPMYNQQMQNNSYQNNSYQNNPQYGQPVSDPYGGANYGAPYNNYAASNMQTGGYGPSPIAQNY